jgi:hypothetical protein
MKMNYFNVNIPKILATKAFSSIFPFVYFSPYYRCTIIFGADITIFFVKASPRISIVPQCTCIFGGVVILMRISL